MSLETLFRLANFVAVIGWIVLVPACLLGRERGIDWICGSAIPTLLAAAYVVVIVAFWGGARVDFSSLAGIMALFRQPAAALAGWLHYLAFDMLVGVLLARRMMQSRMPLLVVVPVLLLTFFAGPAGFLLHQAAMLARGGAKARR